MLKCIFKNYNLKNIKILFTRDDQMKNIDGLQINILRIYINSFEIKYFHLDFYLQPSSFFLSDK